MLELIAILGVVSATGFGYLAMRGFARPKDMAQLSSQLATVDVQAFLNLVNPDEDAFLRRELPAHAYRQVRRMRIRAMLAYLAQASANARILMAYAERAIGSSNGATSELARELATSAIRFQLLALAMRSRLCMAWLIPSAEFLPASFMEAYEQLRFRLQRVLAIEAPATSARMAAGL